MIDRGSCRIVIVWTRHIAIERQWHSIANIMYIMACKEQALARCLSIGIVGVFRMGTLASGGVRLFIPMSEHSDSMGRA